MIRVPANPLIRDGRHRLCEFKCRIERGTALTSESPGNLLSLSWILLFAVSGKTQGALEAGTCGFRCKRANFAFLFRRPPLAILTPDQPTALLMGVFNEIPEEMSKPICISAIGAGRGGAELPPPPLPPPH